MGSFCGLFYESKVLMGLMHDMGVIIYSSRVEDEVKKVEKGAHAVYERMRR